MKKVLALVKWLSALAYDDFGQYFTSRVIDADKPQSFQRHFNSNVNDTRYVALGTYLTVGR